MLDFVRQAQLVALLNVHILFGFANDSFFTRQWFLAILRHGKVRTDSQAKSCDNKIEQFQTAPLDCSYRCLWKTAKQYAKCAISQRRDCTEVVRLCTGSSPYCKCHADNQLLTLDGFKSMQFEN